MATYEQVIQALRNADAQGQTEDAKRLALIANSMRQQPPQSQVPSFNERLEPRLEARGEEVKKTLADHAAGEISTLEAGVQLFGKGVAGSAFDWMGEEINESVIGLSNQFPEFAEGIREGFQKISDSFIGGVVSEVMQGGKEAWGSFKQKFPQEAKTTEALVNTGMLLAPPSVKQNAKPTVLGKASTALEKSAGKTIRRNRREYISELIVPEKTKKVLTEEALRSKEVGAGPFRKTVTELSPREKDIAFEVKKIKGVNSSNTIQGNLNSIQRANTKIAIGLDKQLAKSDVIIPTNESRAAIIQSVQRLVEENPVVVGNAETTARRVATKAMEIVGDHPSTPRGLLQARKELDAWILSQKGKKAFDPTMENALSVSVRAVRRSINDLISDRVPDVRVKSELRRQNLLYDAIDNIAPKAASESNHAILRAWDNATKVLPFRGKINQELALLFGMGGLGAAAAFAPWVTKTAGVLGAGIATKKIIMSPKTRQGVAKLIELTDRAILSSKNPSMVRQLRLDRAALREILNTEESEEQE